MSIPRMFREHWRTLLIATSLLFVFALASSAATEDVDASPAPATQPARTPAGHMLPGEVRKHLRPELSDAEYDAEVKRLRELYSRPAAEWPKALVNPSVTPVEIGLLPEMVHPKDNPHSDAKEAWGKQLFFDPRLSQSKQMACGSCHDPDLAWADGRTNAFGEMRRTLKRNSPTIMNSGYHQTQFWDGRAPTLEAQAKAVLLNSVELNMTAELVEERMNAIPEYRQAAKQAFGTEDITIDHVAKAIATFERSIVGGRSAFDRFVKGRSEALSDSQLRGLHIFRTDGKCMNCHHGPFFSDDQFHNLGISNYGRPFEDKGRYEITGRHEDMGSFRTPGLRNVANTRPYMHSGLFELDEILRMYNVGMPNVRPRKDQVDDPLFPIKSPLLEPLFLNEQDLADLQAFLESLSEPHRRVPVPDLPGLYVATQPADE